MNDVYGFIDAALPWIAIGLMLAVFFARAAVLKKNDGDGEYVSEGMALGMCFGVALSVALHINVGIGMMAGLLLGLLAGSLFAKKNGDARET
ncbi:MAG: hypothetical protein II861_05295 [Methanomicrobium sp.]|nr:hypothetical protein [Methanomicrobium sp.]